MGNGKADRVIYGDYEYPKPFAFRLVMRVREKNSQGWLGCRVYKGPMRDGSTRWGIHVSGTVSAALYWQSQKVIRHGEAGVEKIRWFFTGREAREAFDALHDFWQSDSRFASLQRTR